ncbi:MAG: NADH-quinone oxidoreductase subunit C [Candidatus Eremiobacteraeota bacterium]|nr:NADH-quinone oxidoreductase subunit C [Candidatus Eremiobacteraeota bacterium]MBC5803461.1 NADH-quinone oxidoreductase subunit C [Candidatus Eremiobacteraeota bacterium]MBC5822877.1 NADH-quinone oxidoreductase subunit C [Candidatus Eremiobacteraeota bacterium]
MPSPQAPSIAGFALDPPAVRPPLDDAEIIRVDPGELHAQLAQLKSGGCSLLLDIGGVDYLERDPRFDVVYHLLALPRIRATVAEVGRPRRVRLLVGVGGEMPELASAVDLWPCADWAEREIFDLFGISFAGHPNLHRIQMPEGWEGHPLRKDYPLRGPAREATPRPSFALKSNVPAGTPPSGKVAAALQRRIARVRADGHAPSGEKP